MPGSAGGCRRAVTWKPATRTSKPRPCGRQLKKAGSKGLTIDPEPALLSRHEVLCSGAPTFHLDVQFLVLTEECTKPAFGVESIDVQWFSRDQLPDVDDSVTSLVAAAGFRLGWGA